MDNPLNKYINKYLKSSYSNLKFSQKPNSNIEKKEEKGN